MYTITVILLSIISAGFATEVAKFEIPQDASPQSKLFFRYPWIPLPNFPTRAPAGAAANSTTPATTVCTAANSQPVAATPCTCGTVTTPCNTGMSCQTTPPMCLSACTNAAPTAVGRCVCPAVGGCTTCGAVATMCTTAALPVCIITMASMAGTCGAL